MSWYYMNGEKSQNVKKNEKHKNLVNVLRTKCTDAHHTTTLI